MVARSKPHGIWDKTFAGGIAAGLLRPNLSTAWKVLSFLAVNLLRIEKSNVSIDRSADLQAKCDALEEFRTLAGPQWLDAETWSIPSGAAEPESRKFRELMELKRASERKFWYDTLADTLKGESRAMYLFSALHAPDLFFDYEKPTGMKPLGKWDYADLAFVEGKAPRIDAATQQAFAELGVKNAHLIPNEFEYGDTGWRGAEQLMRYAYWLNHSVEEVRLVGAIIRPAQSGRPVRSLFAPADSVADEYMVIFMNYPFSGDSAFQLAKELLSPHGLLITRPHAFQSSEMRAEFAAVVEHPELSYAAFRCKNSGASGF